MTPDPVAIGPDERAIDQLDLFEKHKFHHLPVRENGEMIGMLSRRDLEHFLTIVRLLTSKQYDLKVREIMTSPIFSYYEDVGIDQAASAMVDNHIHAILVVSKTDERVLGILTSTDLLHYISKSKQYRID